MQHAIVNTLVIGIVVILAPQSLHGEAVLWPVGAGGNGHFYDIMQSPGGIDWVGARALARAHVDVGHPSLRWDLVTVTSSSETQFVNALLTSNGVNDLVHLGGFQDHDDPDYAEPAGGWAWVTGEPWSYTNWHSTEPNENTPGEDCLETKTPAFGFQWNDQRCNTLRNYFLIESLDDCNGNGVADLLDLGDVTSTDCNDDQVPDECDISGMTSNDCNSNGVPDECDADFDGDGVIDDCEDDIDGDGVPDELDACDSTPLGRAVDGTGRPLGDLDWDCDVDLMDYTLFQSGFTGVLTLKLVTIECYVSPGCPQGVQRCSDGFCEAQATCGDVYGVLPDQCGEVVDLDALGVSCIVSPGCPEGVQECSNGFCTTQASCGSGLIGRDPQDFGCN